VEDLRQRVEHRINYLQENPVHAGFIKAAEHWHCGSAVNYYTENEKGLLVLVW